MMEMKSQSKIRAGLLIARYVNRRLICVISPASLIQQRDEAQSKRPPPRKFCSGSQQVMLSASLFAGGTGNNRKLRIIYSVMNKLLFTYIC